MWPHLADSKLSPYLSCLSAASDTAPTGSGLPLAPGGCMLFAACFSQWLQVPPPLEMLAHQAWAYVCLLYCLPQAGSESRQCASDSNLYHSPEHLSGDPLASGTQWRSHNHCKLGISQNELPPPPQSCSLSISVSDTAIPGTACIRDLAISLASFSSPFFCFFF